MTRYTVAENQHGYEINGSHLRYAVIDNAPDMASVYWARDRAHKLHPVNPQQPGYKPLRQIAFCAHVEDAIELASGMNIREGMKRDTSLARA